MASLTGPERVLTFWPFLATAKTSSSVKLVPLSFKRLPHDLLSSPKLHGQWIIYNHYNLYARAEGIIDLGKAPGLKQILEGVEGGLKTDNNKFNV